MQALEFGALRAPQPWNARASGRDHERARSPIDPIGAARLFFSMDANDTAVSLNPLDWRADLSADGVGRLPATLLVLVDRARACDGSLPTCTRISRRAARFCTALAPAPIRSPIRCLLPPRRCSATRWRSGSRGEAIQIHGGYGFTGEFAVSRLYRGARYGSLGGGTSETLRDLIGKRLIANVNDSDGIFGLLDT